MTPGFVIVARDCKMSVLQGLRHGFGRIFAPSEPYIYQMCPGYFRIRLSVGRIEFNCLEKALSCFGSAPWGEVECLYTALKMIVGPKILRTAFFDPSPPCLAQAT